MPPKRKHGKDLPPNLYPATDTRDQVTRYRYRDPRTGRFHGMGCDKESAVADALSLNAIILQSQAQSRVASITAVVSDTPKLSAVILQQNAAKMAISLWLCVETWRYYGLNYARLQPFSLQ